MNLHETEEHFLKLYQEGVIKGVTTSMYAEVSLLGSKIEESELVMEFSLLQGQETYYIEVHVNTEDSATTGTGEYTGLFPKRKEIEYVLIKDKKSTTYKNSNKLNVYRVNGVLFKSNGRKNDIARLLIPEGEIFIK